jgi:ABC-2 type transport system permease protein
MRKQRAGTGGIVHRIRILQVLSAAEFKLKYAGSALGYVWTVLKPLLLFTMLYLVFGRVFKLDQISPYYGLGLLIGIVLFTFLADATMLAMWSLVSRESLLRKLVFPRSVIPMSATITAAITFSTNAVVIMGFVFWKGLVPQPDWILIVPLLLELYLFTLGISLILATLFVRFRDLSQIWELALQLLFYASPIVYPIGYLPGWARRIAFLNPFTQVLQDIRWLLIYPDDDQIVTATTAFGQYGRLLPIGIAFALFGFGVVMFRRDEPWFAERI